MHHGRRVAVCARCGFEHPIQGRGLCQQCYSWVWKAGTLDDYDLVGWSPLAEPAPLVCLCENPTMVDIPLYGGRECVDCRRPLLSDLVT